MLEQLQPDLIAFLRDNGFAMDRLTCALRKAIKVRNSSAHTAVVQEQEARAFRDDWLGACPGRSIFAAVVPKTPPATGNNGKQASVVRSMPGKPLPIR